MFGFRPSGTDRQPPGQDADAQAYLAAIAESSDDAIIAKDLDGVIRWCNESATRMFGYSDDELIGQPVRMLIPPGRQHEEDDILARIRAGERIDHFETVRVRKDGTLIHISLTVSPVRNAAGTIIGVSKVARDITERIQAAAMTAAHQVERERLLESECLARSEAEKASRMKDDFVAMVSHELRTPLNAIMGWTQLMSQGRSDAAVIDRGLDVVARNTRVQAQLIADLLDVSRIVSGKLQLEIQPADMASILRDAIDAVHGEAAQKEITIVPSVGVGLTPIEGDPSRLQQVIWNLLSNAIKFTPAGGRVTVDLSRRGEGLVLVVADTGAGIAPEVLPHIFDRFHQADRSITRRFGGLGLGLSIVKHLVQLHGGTVSATSPGPGAGTTITVELPAAATVRLGHGAHPVLPRVDAHPAVALDGLRVLVVEDEPDTREFLSRLLSNHGASVRTAASAADAVAAFRQLRPDVLISDIGLPDVDGYQLIRQIRREDEDAPDDVPAIALTAYARSEDRTRALLAGFQDHLAKPLDAIELVRAVAGMRRPAAAGGQGEPSA